MRVNVAIAAIAVLFLPTAAPGHPVPKNNHDRTIVVRLQKTETPNRIRVRVEYRLEVDEETVLLRDMRDYKDEVNFLDYFPKRPLEYYAEFTKIYAPIYIDHFVAEVNKKPIGSFKCVNRQARLKDDDGKTLGHLRCDFVIENAFDLVPGEKAHFSFHDQTYLSGGIAPEPGMLALSIVNETGLTIDSKMEPDEALRKRPIEELTANEEDRLRRVAMTLSATAGHTPVPEIPGPPPDRTPRESQHDRFSLMQLFLHSEYGFWLTLLLAFLFGAAHALTPGHGKTLVAAYLVGERGTIWHALFLGLITTLTHTGVVILLAIIMTVLSEEAQRTFQKVIENGLGLVLGLIIVCMGFAILLQRLAGRADHIHIGGGHHHDHGPAAPESTRTLSWWGLVLLGVTGGLIPCWDAIILLFSVVGTSRFWMVLPMVLAFSTGLAAVLVLIGILVVQVPRFVEARGGDGRVMRALPKLSALAVIAVGLWLCYEWSQGR